MKLFDIQKDVISGQCKGALLRIQIRYTAIFIGCGIFKGWAGGQVGLFAPYNFKNGKGFSCRHFYFHPWLAPDIPVMQIPHWYRRIMRMLSFGFPRLYPNVKQ